MVKMKEEIIFYKAKLNENMKKYTLLRNKFENYKSKSNEEMNLFKTKLSDNIYKYKNSIIKIPYKENLRKSFKKTFK